MRPTRQHALLLLAFVLTVALSYLTNGVEAGCPPGLKCRVCADRADCNMVPTFPRFTIGGTTSNNLADFDLMECASSSTDPMGHPVRQDCKLRSISITTPNGSDDVANYVVSLGFYVVFTALLGIGTLIAGICFFIFRYACCCCCFKSYCCGRSPTTQFGVEKIVYRPLSEEERLVLASNTVQLETVNSNNQTVKDIESNGHSDEEIKPDNHDEGSKSNDKHEPHLAALQDFVFDETPKTCCDKCCTCCPCLGMTRNPRTLQLEYSNKAKWVTRIYVGIFLSMVFSFIFVAIFKGNAKIPQTTKYALNEATGGALNIVNNLGDRTLDLTMELVGTSLKQTVNNMTEEIETQILNLDTLKNNTICVTDALIDSIPDFVVIRSYITDADNIFNSVSSSIVTSMNSLKTDMMGVSTDLGNVQTEIQAVGSVLTAMETTANAIDVSVTANHQAAIATAADQITNQLTSWSQDNGDLATLGSTLNTAADDLNAFATSPETCGSTCLDGLITQLGGVKSELDALNLVTAYDAAFGVFHTHLETLASHPDGVLVGIQNDAQGHIDALSTAKSALASKINDAKTSANALNPSGVVNEITTANSKLEPLYIEPPPPEKAAFLDQIDQSRKLDTAVGCMTVLEGLLDIVRAKAVTFEALDDLDLASIKTQLQDVITEMADARDQVNDKLNQLATELTDLDYAVYATSLEQAIDTLKTSFANNNALSADVLNPVIDNLQSQVDNLAGHITSLRAALLTPEEEAVMVPSTSSYVLGVASQLGSMISRLTTLRSGSGKCTVDDSACDVDTDCASGQCVRTEGTCMSSPATACTDDAACSAGDTCSFPQTTTPDLKTKLSNLGTVFSNLDNFGNRVSDAKSQDCVTTVTTLKGIMSVGSSATSSLDSAVQDAKQQLDQAVSDLDSQTTATSEMFDTIAAVGLDTLENKIDELEVQITDVQNEHVPTLEKVRGTLNTLVDFIRIKLPDYLDRLETSILRAKLANEGAYGMIRYIAEVVDEAVEYLSTNQTGIAISLSSVASKVDKYKKDIDTFIDRKHRSQSFLHWGMFAFSNDDNIMMPGDPRAIRGRVLTDENGVRYADGVRCYLTSCIINEVNYIWSGANLKQAFQEALWVVSNNEEPKPTSIPDVKLTIEQAAMIPLVFPALVFVFSLLTVLLFCRTRLTKWLQTFFGSMAVGCMFCQLPFIFLVLAAVFPAAILSSDACYSAESMLVKHWLPSNDHCKMLQGKPDPVTGMCVVDKALTVQFDSFELIRGVLGICGTEAQNAFAALHASVREEVNKLPGRVYDDYILTTDVVQPTLSTILTGTKSFWEVILDAYAVDLTGIVSCNTIAQAYQDVKKTPCCGMNEGLWWVASSWYMIAWSMLFCGIPSLLLARKRLPYEPWGNEYEENQQELNKADGGKDPQHKAEIELAPVNKKHAGSDDDEAVIPPTPATHARDVALEVLPEPIPDPVEPAPATDPAPENVASGPYVSPPSLSPAQPILHPVLPPGPCAPVPIPGLRPNPALRQNPTPRPSLYPQAVLVAPAEPTDAPAEPTEQ